MMKQAQRAGWAAPCMQGWLPILQPPCSGCIQGMPGVGHNSGKTSKRLTQPPWRPPTYQHECMRCAPGAQVGCIVEQLDGPVDVCLHTIAALSTQEGPERVCCWLDCTSASRPIPKRVHNSARCCLHCLLPTPGTQCPGCTRHHGRDPLPAQNRGAPQCSSRVCPGRGNAAPLRQRCGGR